MRFSTVLTLMVLVAGNRLPAVESPVPTTAHAALPGLGIQAESGPEIYGSVPF
jgi:hypothetical protein